MAAEGSLDCLASESGRSKVKCDAKPSGSVFYSLPAPGCTSRFCCSEVLNGAWGALGLAFNSEAGDPRVALSGLLVGLTKHLKERGFCFVL